MLQPIRAVRRMLPWVGQAPAPAGTAPAALLRPVRVFGRPLLGALGLALFIARPPRPTPPAVPRPVGVASRPAAEPGLATVLRIPRANPVLVAGIPHLLPPKVYQQPWAVPRFWHNRLPATTNFLRYPLEALCATALIEEADSATALLVEANGAKTLIQEHFTATPSAGC